MSSPSTTSQAAYPAVAELLPHGPGAAFLERVLELTGEAIACEVVPGARDGVYAENGMIPAELCIEYMAQAIAAYAGLRAPEGRRREVGYIIAVRKLELHVTGFTLGQPLTVRAMWEWGEANLARFHAVIERDGEPLATAFLSVFRPQQSTP